MSFGIKDAIDIIVVATLMFYIYPAYEGVGHDKHIFRHTGFFRGLGGDVGNS